MLLLVLDGSLLFRFAERTLLYRTRSQIALFQRVESAICDRGYYIVVVPRAAPQHAPWRPHSKCRKGIELPRKKILK